ncbi:MAG: phage tail tube protein [Methylotenera sp.]|nr:phage tail tube protein [Methylotenera sp.]
MASAPKVAGTCYVKVDGSQLELKGDSGIEAPPFSVTREVVMGQSGVAGLKETAKTPYIKGTFIVGPDFPREKLDTGTDITATVEFINGSVYTLSGAFVVGDSAYKSDSGELDLELNGIKGIWA